MPNVDGLYASLHNAPPPQRMLELSSMVVGIVEANPMTPVKPLILLLGRELEHHQQTPKAFVDGDDVIFFARTLTSLLQHAGALGDRVAACARDVIDFCSIKVAAHFESMRLLDARCPVVAPAPRAARGGKKHQLGDKRHPPDADVENVVPLAFMLAAESDLVDDYLRLMDMAVGVAQPDIVGSERRAPLDALVSIWAKTPADLTPRWTRCFLVMLRTAMDDTAVVVGRVIDHARPIPDACQRLADLVLPAVCSFCMNEPSTQGALLTDCVDAVLTLCREHALEADLHSVFLLSHLALACSATHAAEAALEGNETPVVPQKQAKTKKRPSAAVVQTAPFADSLQSRLRQFAFRWLAPYRPVLEAALAPESTAPAWIVALAVGHEAMRWGCAITMTTELSWYLFDEDAKEELPEDAQSRISNALYRSSPYSQGSDFDLRRLIQRHNHRARLLPTRPTQARAVVNAFLRQTGLPRDSTAPPSLRDAVKLAFAVAPKSPAMAVAAAVQLRMVAEIYAAKQPRVHFSDPHEVLEERHLATDIMHFISRLDAMHASAYTQDLLQLCSARPAVWCPLLTATGFDATLRHLVGTPDAAGTSPTDTEPSRRRRRLELDCAARNPAKAAAEALIAMAEAQPAAKQQRGSSHAVNSLPRLLDAYRQFVRSPPMAVEHASDAHPLVPFLRRCVDQQFVARDVKGLVALATFINHVQAEDPAAIDSLVVTDAKLVGAFSTFVVDVCRAVVYNVPATLEAESVEVAVEAASALHHVRFCAAENNPSAGRCGGGHPLRVWRGTWQCNECGVQEAVALSCLQCQEFYCARCAADRGNNRIDDGVLLLKDVDGTDHKALEPHRVPPSADAEGTNAWFVIDVATGEATQVVDRWTIYRAAQIAGTSWDHDLTVHVASPLLAGGCACGALARAYQPPNLLDRPSALHTALFHAAITASELARVNARRVLSALANVTRTVLTGTHSYGMHKLVELFRPALPVGARQRLLESDFNSFDVIAKHAGDVGSYEALTQGPRKPPIAARRDVSIVGFAAQHADDFLALEKVSVEFEGEAGFGEGPVQEYYISLFENAYAQDSLWHSSTLGALIPKQSPTTRAKDPVKYAVRALGICMARAMFDAFLVPNRVHPVVWQLMFADIQFRSQARFAKAAKEMIFRAMDTPMAEHILSLRQASAEDVEMLCLEHGNGEVVTLDTVDRFIDDYVTRVAEPCYLGVIEFSCGFGKIIAPSVVRSLFTADEILQSCGGHSDAGYFTREALQEVIHPAHGYTWSSPQLGWLVDALSTLVTEDQQHFVEFLTGSKMLPAGGWQNMGKPITVVRKDFEGSNQLTLPTCSTCFLYLKLPPYASKETLVSCLLTAVREGRRNFALS
jgi:hypothetical protein